MHPLGPSFHNVLIIGLQEVTVAIEKSLDKPAGAYGEHQLQLISRSYGWTIGLNGTGLLACFAFIISEYQVVYNDCLSEYVASNSISFAAWVSITFLLGGLASGFGIVVHTTLLGKYIYARQKKTEPFLTNSMRQPDKISVSECKRLVACHTYIWVPSLILFGIGLAVSYVAVFNINPTSVHGTVSLLSKECPAKVSPFASPAS